MGMSTDVNISDIPPCKWLCSLVVSLAFLYNNFGLIHLDPSIKIGFCPADG